MGKRRREENRGWTGAKKKYTATSFMAWVEKAFL